ncbi:hypothetical protein Pmani_008013 [Petrolisthes manimaculis]|uniref:Uncharacterized protein n=1 Tax=Petrolisthes manimaculis TaxID=1843537 RepID=A0AAE1UI50_9EUCA|nr:hypothetical protein Pmani_008013 [Petrolisthes manimaculis]
MSKIKPERQGLYQKLLLLSQDKRGAERVLYPTKPKTSVQKVPVLGGTPITSQIASFMSEDGNGMLLLLYSVVLSRGFTKFELYYYSSTPRSDQPPTPTIIAIDTRNQTTKDEYQCHPMENLIHTK